MCQEYDLEIDEKDKQIKESEAKVSEKLKSFEDLCNDYEEEIKEKDDKIL